MKSKKYSLLALISLCLILFLLISSASADPEWWNTSFSSRISNTISTNGTSTPADYQVLLNITYDSAMQDDFDDIRFTNSTGGTELSYWIESKVNGSYANVWVNSSDAIADPGSDTVWMYYGNAEVSDGGVGADTFDFFDDLEDGDTTDWTKLSGATFVAQNTTVKNRVYSGRYSTPTTTGAQVYKGFTAINETVIEWDARVTAFTTDPKYYIIAKTAGTITDSVYLAFRVDGIYYYDTAWKSLQTANLNQWYHFKVVSHAASNTFDIYIDGVNKGSGLACYGSITGGVTTFDIFNNQLSNDMFLDNLFKHKYIANEPTLATGTAQYYTDSLLYNTTENYNHTIESDGTITANRSIVAADDTNDTASSIGTSYLIINAYNNSALTVRNFTITGDVLDWYQAANLSGSFTLNNASGVLETQSDVGGLVNFTTNLSVGTYTIEVSSSDSSFTVSLPTGELELNFTATTITDTHLEPSGQAVGTSFFNITNTGNIVQSFRFYLNSSITNVNTYASLSGDLSSPTEITTTTSTVIVTDLAASGSDDVWIYLNLTKPAPGTYSRNITINSS